MIKWLQVCFVITMLVACGGKDNGGTVDAPGGGSDGGTTGSGDGGPTGGCVPGTTQCSNCIDDDGDGTIDGFDIGCTVPDDNDESSFATGIPGDNKDAVNQDCFFDGDSGAGNDGCNIHVCCLLGATSVAECPTGASQYDPTECPPPLGSGTLDPQCIETCGAATPPGCDCFGCCTICDGTTCVDVNINLGVSPDCTPDTINDPTKCVVCTKSTLCNGGGCNDDPNDCILCPGQDPSDLPAGCMEASCPDGQQTCDADTPCGAGTFCASGCCVEIIL